MLDDKRLQEIKKEYAMHLDSTDEYEMQTFMVDVIPELITALEAAQERQKNQTATIVNLQEGILTVKKNWDITIRDRNEAQTEVERLRDENKAIEEHIAEHGV